MNVLEALEDLFDKGTALKYALNFINFSGTEELTFYDSPWGVIDTFIWEDTTEGHNFWENIADQLSDEYTEYDDEDYALHTMFVSTQTCRDYKITRGKLNKPKLKE